LEAVVVAHPGVTGVAGGALAVVACRDILPAPAVAVSLRVGRGGVGREGLGVGLLRGVGLLGGVVGGGLLRAQRREVSEDAFEEGGVVGRGVGRGEGRKRDLPAESAGAGRHEKLLEGG
jgi:hypothetical protein